MKVDLQKLYGDLSGKMLQLTTNHLVGTASRFVNYWSHQELCVSPGSVGLKGKKQGVLTMKREATIVLLSPSTKKFYIAVRNEW